ncbi:MAG: DUF2610 domain-containing protein [Rickettsiaceae bacterium]|nr:MAG: DUF2610 domain-containing protein [Rickettsiaceae bacterium]
MKMFNINCDFNGQMAPFPIYIGQPEGSHHPAKFQANWLSSEKQGMIPTSVMEALTKLKEVADKNSVLLEDLCVYALGAEQQEDINNLKTEVQEPEEQQQVEETYSEKDN